MPVTVTWGTKIINVPQDYLDDLGGDVYELDTNQMRLDLKALEDNEEGISHLDTHSHNTTVTVGGVTLARVFQIINGYTVTFEDGQYAVELAGTNNNIPDVSNVNQVSIRSFNSAGMIETGTSGLTSEEAADLDTAAAQATLARKIGSNKAVIAGDELSVIIYDDNGTTPLYTFTISGDKLTRTPV